MGITSMVWKDCKISVFSCYIVALVDNGVKITIVLIYVQDLIITGDDLEEVTWIRATLSV